MVVVAAPVERPDASQVFTVAVDGSRPRWLGSFGHVTGLHYSYACPGGCDQLTATLQISARERPDAIDPGRRVRVVRGASVVWRGTLDEPNPGPDGWSVTAHGTGTYGSGFAATYPGTWGTSTPDAAVNAAVSRGLTWANPGIGNPAGMWVGQPVDSGAQQIDDLLNLICTKGGLTWYVATRAVGNVLGVFPLPTAVTNLLVSSDPVARTLAGDINTIFLRYQTTADAAASPATYSTTSVQDAVSVAKYGPMETFADLSSAQVLTAAAAQAVGNLVLKRFTRASFAGPFTAGPGQLLTAGGAPVDLGAGMPLAPMVCRLLMTDFAYGADQAPGPVSFLVGNYEFDDDTQTAQITPFQQVRTDLASLLAMVVSTEPARQIASAGSPHVTRTRRK